jgi:hypothetical protein
METTMKILSIIAIALSLIGATNLARAQESRDLGVITGSEANEYMHEHGYYAPDYAGRHANRYEHERGGYGPYYSR